MTATKSFDVNALAGVSDQAIAIHQVLKGNFEDEIARLKAARADLDSALQIASTVEAANEILANAKKKDELADKQLLRANSDAAAKVAEANKALAQVQTLKSDVDSKGARLLASLDEFEQAKKDHEDDMATRHANLNVREAHLAQGQSDLKEAQAALQADKAAFNKRLEALRA